MSAFSMAGTCSTTSAVSTCYRVEKVMKALRVRRLMLFPRFHVSVKDSLEVKQPEVGCLPVAQDHIGNVQSAYVPVFCGAAALSVTASCRCRSPAAMNGVHAVRHDALHTLAPRKGSTVVLHLINNNQGQPGCWSYLAKVSGATYVCCTV